MDDLSLNRTMYGKKYSWESNKNSWESNKNWKPHSKFGIPTMHMSLPNINNLNNIIDKLMTPFIIICVLSQK